MAASLQVFLTATDGVGAPAGMLGDLGLFVALVLAGFAVAFGTRHADATEHQDGLTLAVALESVVKLIAFLTVGGFVVGWMLRDLPESSSAVHGLGALAGQTSGPATLIVQTCSRPPPCCCCRASSTWRWWRTARSPMSAGRPGPSRSTSCSSTCFVVPLALAGLALFPEGTVQRDMTVLALPLHERADGIALVAFIGGLSAATAMVIVESVAVAIMISNHLVIPVALRRRNLVAGAAPSPEAGAPDLGGYVLVVRRIAIVAVVLVAYAYSRSPARWRSPRSGFCPSRRWRRSARPSSARSIGARHGPGRRRGAHRRFRGLALHLAAAEPRHRGRLGRLAHRGRTVRHRFLEPDGADGRRRLSPPGPRHAVEPRPQHARLSRLLAPARPSAIERLQAEAFGHQAGPGAPSFRLFRSAVTLGELRATVARFLGEERAVRAFEDFAHGQGRAPLRDDAVAGLPELRHAEHLLASAIGASSARLALSLLLRRRNVSPKAALKLLDDASAAFQYSRDILQHGLDHAKQGITVFDRDMKLIVWNRAFADLYDLPPT